MSNLIRGISENGGVVCLSACLPIIRSGQMQHSLGPR